MNQQLNPQDREKTRISDLLRYGVLDTPADSRLDEITRIAAGAFEVPIAMVSFIDQDRQWIKSQVGVELKEIKRIYAFCNHAIESGQTLIVSDTTKDDRFKNSPIVAGAPFIRFYAATPLTTHTGSHLGTICIMDHKPREFPEFQKKLLEHLARLVMLELETDLTQKQVIQTESILNASSRLAAVGDLAAGIAHEINNPLAVIQARMSHLKRLADCGKMTNDVVLQNAGKIEKVVDRIQSIVKGLNSFVLNKSNEPVQNVSVSHIIQDSMFFLEDRLKATKIDFKVDDITPYESVRLSGRSVQICQAISNLLINAIDAVQESNPPQWIRIGFKETHDRFQIRIYDSAPLIPMNIAVKLFHPFFTTKGAGKGTGLGLSVSRSLVESFNGKLFLDQVNDEKAFVVELAKDQPQPANAD